MKLIITMLTDKAKAAYKEIDAIGEKQSATNKLITSKMYKETIISQDPLIIEVQILVRGIIYNIYSETHKKLEEYGLTDDDYTIKLEAA
jgi:hypothetical protein